MLFAYDPTRNIWTRKANMLELGARGVTGVIKGKLYVVSTCYETDSAGGEYWDAECGMVEGGRPDRSNFFRYDPVTDRWVRLPKPRRTYHMGAVLYDKLYVTNGKNLEMFDPITSQWTVKASGPQERPPGTAVAQGGKLYLFGGSKINSVGQLETLRSTSVYNPLTNTWGTAALMPAARYGVSASRVFLDGRPRIEVVGGRPPGNNLQYIP
jgi:N-acetylneuraminic acid mutarotase